MYLNLKSNKKTNKQEKCKFNKVKTNKIEKR